jgi:glycosyltransferase involved in cell wall biosynthesis
VQTMDVSAVVCTLNSAASLNACLVSLKQSGVAEIIVVDAGSTDGSITIALHHGAKVLTDGGIGLGAARNVGIAASKGRLILNMGADNYLPPLQLEVMRDALKDCQGVGAVTFVNGRGFIAHGLNAWRRARFQPGPVDIIGTPSLFDGDTLRAHPFDEGRRFSDDSELCERWRLQLGARFVISRAIVMESGRVTWSELCARCTMYGISDGEVFRSGVAAGWSWRRRVRSMLHPLRVDLIQPMRRLPLPESLSALPFLLAFVSLRYWGWLRSRHEEP